MKRMARILCGIALLYSYTGYAADISLEDMFWAEGGGNISYLKTGFSTNTPDETEEDFYWSYINAYMGVRFDLCERLFLDPYLTASFQYDFGNKAWNKVYWNNNLTWGPGLRLEYDYVDDDNIYDEVFWIDNLIVDLFAEYLLLENSPDGGKENVPADVWKENVRSGVSTWVSMWSKQVEDFSLWGEMWGEWAYGSTDFSEKYDKDFYILYLEPLLGIEWDLGEVSLQPYYRLFLARDFGDKTWNKQPWLNFIEYGPGIRFSLGDLIEFGDASVHLYAEYRGIDYFSRVDKAEYEDLSSYDRVVGINFYLQFGAVRGTRIFR